MEKLAKLAMLDIKCEDSLLEDIESILKMTDILSEVESEKSEHHEEWQFRDDAVKHSFDREDLLSNAPCVEDGFVIVPKVVG